MTLLSSSLHTVCLPGKTFSPNPHFQILVQLWRWSDQVQLTPCHGITAELFIFNYKFYSSSEYIQSWNFCFCPLMVGRIPVTICEQYPQKRLRLFWIILFSNNSIMATVFFFFCYNKQCYSNSLAPGVGIKIGELPAGPQGSWVSLLFHITDILSVITIKQH